jgi:copper transport protein
VIALDGYVIREQYKFILKEPSDSIGQTAELRLVKSIPEDGQVVNPSPEQIDLWFNQPAEITALGVFSMEGTHRTIEPAIDPNDPQHVVVGLDEVLS